MFMRIGIAALHHETNSFSNIPMNWEYLRKTRFEKETYRDIYAPRRNYSGGFIVKGKELGIEIIDEDTVKGWLESGIVG